MEPLIINAAVVTIYYKSETAVVPLAAVASFADVKALVAERFGLHQVDSKYLGICWKCWPVFNSLTAYI